MGVPWDSHGRTKRLGPAGLMGLRSWSRGSGTKFLLVPREMSMSNHVVFLDKNGVLRRQALNPCIILDVFKKRDSWLVNLDIVVPYLVDLILEAPYLYSFP